MIFVKKEIQKDFPPVPSSFIDRMILKVQVALINARTPHMNYIPFPLRSILVTLGVICFSVSLWSLISFYTSSWSIITFLVFVGLSNFGVYHTAKCCWKVGKYYWITLKIRILCSAHHKLLSIRG